MELTKTNNISFKFKCFESLFQNAKFRCFGSSFRNAKFRCFEGSFQNVKIGFHLWEEQSDKAREAEDNEHAEQCT